MAKLINDVRGESKPTLNQQFYIGLSFPTAPYAEMAPHIPEHVQYMIENEEKVFLSGPFIEEGQPAGEALTVLLTDQDAAMEFMQNEPFIKRGLRRFELKIWEVREGSLTLSMRLSQTSFSFNSALSR